jgi:cyclase
MIDVVEKVAEQVFIPLTVGGGLRTVDDMQQMLQAGADKVSINTAAVEQPELVQQGAERFGCQCIVLGLDAMRVPGTTPQRWEVRVRTGHGGGSTTGLDAIKWAQRSVELGAGEIVVNSMDRDGTREGYDLELLRALSERVTVPVVASGGAGTPEHMYQVLTEGKADAALASGIFHYGVHTVGEAKEYLHKKGMPVRPLLAA